MIISTRSFRFAVNCWNCESFRRVQAMVVSNGYVDVKCQAIQRNVPAGILYKLSLDGESGEVSYKIQL